MGIKYFRCIPLQQFSQQQKLSKIETLRLARNYIIVLSQVLAEDRPMESSRLLHTLSQGLSQATANQLAGSFGIPCQVSHCGKIKY